MAEEKQTLEVRSVDDMMSQEDTLMLRAVLRDCNSRGVAPVSVYRPTDYEDGEVLE